MLRIILNKLTRILTVFYDPLVTVRIGSAKIKAPLSHALKGILKVYPQFGYNITRLVKYTNETFPDLVIIDIGANIGDTAAFISNYKDLPVLCIDGDEKYFKLLESNLSKFPRAVPCLALVGETDVDQQKKLVREKGTAYLEDTAAAVPFRSMDNILEEFSSFRGSKFMKIDTDGYDTDILRGSKNFIQREQPVLFFEYDPGLIAKKGEAPLSIFPFLRDCGYEYVIVYQNIGDYLISLQLSDDMDKLMELANYYMGRDTHLYADLCVFHRQDKPLFERAKEGETAYFANLRNFIPLR